MYGLELSLIILATNLKSLCILLIKRLHWELLLIVFKEGTELEVIFGIQIRLDGHIVLNKLQKLLLKLIDLLCDKEWINEGEISIRQISIVPDFLGDQEGA